MKENSEYTTVFLKATNKQLRNGEVTFEEIRYFFKELKINSQDTLKKAKKDKLIRIPNYYHIVEIYQEKHEGSFDNFMGFVRSKTKSRKIDILLNDDFIEKIKKWCSNNNIHSQGDYLVSKNRPKEFPTAATIVKNYGDDYFTEVLGLTKYKATFEDKLLTAEFAKKIKDWCISNNITSIIEYRRAKRPKEFPSHESIRQVYGYEYFGEILEIVSNYEYLSIHEAREACIENHIFTSNNYQNFRKSYNAVNTKKLPGNLNQHYNTNWAEFIALSATQLFIGKSMSSLELFTYKLLFDRNISFEIEKTFNDCRSKYPLPFDFYLPNVLDIPVIIELDGDQHGDIDVNHHFYSVNTKKHDEIKNDYCEYKGIKLVRIKSILYIEPTLNEEIFLCNHAKIKDLDWTIDFEEENKIINSHLSKSTKVKLLLLMGEKGKSALSNVEIIKLVKIKKSHFYTIMNELINLKLINRPNDYYFSDEEMQAIVELYNQGRSIAEISRISGYKNRAYLVKRLKLLGVDHQSRKSSRDTKSDSNKL